VQVVRLELKEAWSETASRRATTGYKANRSGERAKDREALKSPKLCGFEGE